MARIIDERPGLDYDDVLIKPHYNKVLRRSNVDLETKFTRNWKIRLPLVAANMKDVCEVDMALALGRLGAVGVLHRFMPIDEEARQAKMLFKENLEVVAAAIGVKDYKDRAHALVDAGANVLVIDIAHGHSKYAGKVLDYLKQEYPSIDIVAGNIATKDAARYFLSKGADAVKVGIGPGEVCTTRDNTGVGVPQLTAVMDVYDYTRGEIPVIADGGIKFPGDVAKALGAGADSAMCGFIFAGCNEAPGKGRYRGSASADIRGEAAFVEGRERGVESTGPVASVIKKYVEGISSSMTYFGAKNMNEFRGRVDFTIRQRPNGIRKLEEKIDQLAGRLQDIR